MTETTAGLIVHYVLPKGLTPQIDKRLAKGEVIERPALVLEVTKPALGICTLAVFIIPGRDGYNTTPQIWEQVRYDPTMLSGTWHFIGGV